MAKPNKKPAAKKPAATKKPAPKKPAPKRPAATKAATKAAKPSALQLELESGKIIKAVRPDQLRAAIDGEEFAILGRGARNGTYIQTARQDEAPYQYILEYQVGTIAEHFSADHPGISLDAIVAVFTKYLTDDPSWQTDFTWQRMKL